MRVTRIEYGSRSRRGFTLIELLVVVGILLLLTTFTVLAVDFTFQTERVRAAARQVQSLLEGARDRAIKAREPRGVRFLLDQDPDSGRMVSSMVYVGAAQPWSEGHITLRRPDFNNDGTADQDTVLIVDGSPETLWNNLKLRGFLGIYEYDANNNGNLDPSEDLNGNGVFDQETPRIKIPGDKNGTWYRVRTHWLGVDPQNPHRFELVQPYRDPGTTPASEVVAFEGTGPSTYVLELPPRILPDAEPVMLPDGVVIDLDASQVPSFWRPQRDPSPSATNALDYAMPYSNRMDLMFSPRGTVTESAAGSGLLHFSIGLRGDVQNFMTASRVPVYGTGAARVPMDSLFNAIPAAAWQGSSRPVVGDRALVSVFTSTGKVASHPLDLIDLFNNTTGAAGADNYADDPFVFAELGEVSSQ